MSQPNLIHSKLARRIFLLFICCALVPIVALAVLSYFHVTSNMRDQSIRRLSQTTKATAMSIYEKLLFLEAELTLVRAQWRQDLGNRSTDFASAVLNQGTKRFKALALLDGPRQIPFLNRIEKPPRFTSNRTRGIEFNKTIIKTSAVAEGPPRVFLALTTGDPSRPDALIVGEIDTAYLWGIGHQNTLPPGTELCVLDHDGNLLISSLDIPVDLLKRRIAQKSPTANRRFDWNYKGRNYLASYKDLFLEAGFDAMSWTVILTQPHALVFQTLRGFKIIFPLVMLLSILVVLFLSMVFIRKSTGPLGRLQQATEAVAAGDFSRQVTIHSGDEFENLASAFNAMTGQLQQQFNRLGLIARIGRTIVGVLAAERVVESVSSAMADGLGFDHGAVLLSTDVHQTTAAIAGYGFRQKALQAMACAFAATPTPGLDERLSHLLKARQTLTIDTSKPAPRPSLLTSLSELADQPLHAVLVKPVLYEKRTVGVLLLADAQPRETIADSDGQLLTSIASQVAACFANIIAYQSLQVSEARFRKAFDHAAAGMAIISPRKYFLQTNQHLDQMLGYGDAQLNRLALNQIVDTDDWPALENAFDAMLANQIPFHISEKKFRHQNGQLVWGLVSTSLLSDRDGHPLHFISQIQDITRQKTAEKETRELEAQLQQAQKMEAIGTLAGGIAHDFNNILSAIIGHSQLGMLNQNLDEQTRGRLDQIYKASQRATELVRQILTFSRKTDHDMKPVEIGPIIKEALKLIRSSLPASIEIFQDIADATGVVQADPTQIHQIIMNLCTNAHHAMQDQGGQLQVVLRQRSMTGAALPDIPDLRAGEYIQLTVADTGCGMDAETKERIFEPYFSTKEQGKGTGLGLSVVHGIVKSHGAAMTVASRPGHGTTFDIYFPRTDTLDEPAVPLAAEIRTGNERILLVDDEEMIVTVGKDMLTHLGYRVEGQTDPLKALEVFKARQDDFELVITDMTMPKMMGDRLARELMRIKPGLPIIMSTGYNELIDQEKATALGIRALINKPFIWTEISQMIRRVLDAPMAPV